MKVDLFSRWVRQLVWPALLPFCLLSVVLSADANPTGGSVTHGSATFSSSGPTFNINQSSTSANITWQSFNIGAGETVNFNQPSASSVTWNQINDPNPSQILGSLNANGYVILQNSAGFFVGGQASINAHGLIMTTASTPTLNLGGGGPWSFSAPPPTAKIVNYGQINITGGGSAYLIANDIENNGTISAPGGKIGLYAGEQVLVSTSPDGRGLSAEATIPQGLVDNNGNLVANAGSVTLQAQMVNQNGLIQANSAQNVNGTIELVAGDSVNLGANSTISAQGDSQGISSGGSVSIQGGNTFSDQAGSIVNISGGAQGGNAGSVEMSAPVMGAINTVIDGQALDGFTGGALTIDPANIWLSSSAVDPLVTQGYTVLNINSFSGMSQISLEANQNIALNADWNLADRTAPATLRLTAGNSIILNNSISAGNNWSLDLTTGAAYSGNIAPASGIDGLYLNGNASLRTQNGNINLMAANSVIVSSGGITTANGGSIDVTTEFGDVNTGTSDFGFDYLSTAPYQKPDSQLGGISTANGGNVNINAGGDVISYSSTTYVQNPNPTYSNSGFPDPGSGCFGSAPGNVTINAGGNVFGCFVVMNGSGTINAQNIGTSANNVALSLAQGGWNLNAQNSIYLQEVRNPNGLFNSTTVFSHSKKVPSAGSYLFNYGQQAYVTLDAGNSVDITGFDLPRNPNGGVPLLLPPVVNINAGPGGVILDTPNTTDGVILSDSDITLFPSPYQNLDITTAGGGWLSSGNNDGEDTALLMSDSADTQWFNASSSTSSGNGGAPPFSENDHSSVPLELNNNNPVTINLNGSQLVNGVPVAAGMQNIVLQTDKATQINVAGDMIGCSFYGENLHPGDVTSINVGGQIYSAGTYTSITLPQGFSTLPADDTPLPGELSVSFDNWYAVLALAVDPNILLKYLPKNNDGSLASLANYSLSELATFIDQALTATALADGTLNISAVAYNPNTKTLTAIGPLDPNLAATLESPTFQVIRFNANGYPVLDANGHLVLDTVSWVPSGSADVNLISSLQTQSQNSIPLGGADGAYVVGGTGQFNITAGSITLGNSAGILSVGDDNSALGRNYSYLAPYFTSAANINVKVADYLEMPASTIACVASGGSVTVTANGEIPNSPSYPLNGNGIGVSMDLGSPALLPFETDIINSKGIGPGIYTTGGGDVNVAALGTINIDSSRVATFDGGNINVISWMGDVNAGSGGTVPMPISYYSPNYFENNVVEYVPANGIVAATLTGGHSTPLGAALLPGNITVETPEGSIFADAGGISQLAYNETLSSSDRSAAITLNAGSPGYIGDLNLGNSGVIGINVNATASGNINGLIIAEQNANINSAGNISGTIFSGGVTSISSGGTISGNIVAIGGLNTSGGGNLSATVFTSSINGGAGTLATTATASSSSQSAANQSTVQAQQQLASNSSDDDKKKKKKQQLRTIGRVTVILNGAS